MESNGRGSKTERDPARRFPANAMDRTDDDGRRVGVLASKIPDAVAAGLLTCSLEAPTRFSIGRSSEFRFHVKNRAPTGLLLTLPTSRSWGWRIDDEPEAGIGRFDPPPVPSKLAFGPRERLTFAGTWDGQIRDRVDGQDVWTPVPGERELTAYVAVDDWNRRGLYARRTVEVA